MFDAFTARFVSSISSPHSELRWCCFNLVLCVFFFSSSFCSVFVIFNIRSQPSLLMCVCTTSHFGARIYLLYNLIDLAVWCSYHIRIRTREKNSQCMVKIWSLINIFIEGCRICCFFLSRRYSVWRVYMCECVLFFPERSMYCSPYLLSLSLVIYLLTLCIHGNRAKGWFSLNCLFYFCFNLFLSLSLSFKLHFHRCYVHGILFFLNSLW